MEVEKAQKSEDQLFCTESPEKTRMRRKIWAHPSGASVSCARATTYLDVCDLNMILKDGKITIAPGIEPEASESEEENEVKEYMENEDSEQEEDHEVEEDGGEVQGEVIEILSSDGEGDSEGHESEEIPDTEDEQEFEQPEAITEEDDDDLDDVEDDEDDEESLGDEDSDEDEEELEDPEEHDSIPCGGNFDDDQENNKVRSRQKV